VQNYTINHRDIISMQLLNKDIEGSVSSINQLRNYNNINKNTEDFEKLLKRIEANIVLHYPQNKKLQDYLQNTYK